MLHNLFPTPLFSFFLEEDKRNKNNYMDYLYALKERDKGNNRSNVNSWHSSPSINLLIEKELEQLKLFVVESSKSVIKSMGYDNIKLGLVESWCIISPKGAYNKNHTHPGAFLSGSYYINNPSSPIIFHDPRPIKTFTEPANSTTLTTYNTKSVHINPKEGNLLIFPSWLEHSVAENTSDQDRVIISFNFALR